MGPVGPVSPVQPVQPVVPVVPVGPSIPNKFTLANVTDPSFQEVASKIFVIPMIVISPVNLLYAPIDPSKRIFNGSFGMAAVTIIALPGI